MAAPRASKVPMQAWSARELRAESQRTQSRGLRDRQIIVEQIIGPCFPGRLAITRT